MKQPDALHAKLEQRTHIIMTLIALILPLLLIQLWLLTIALEEFMAAHTALALPTFGASGFCLLLNLWLLRYLYAADSIDDGRIRDTGIKDRGIEVKGFEVERMENKR